MPSRREINSKTKALAEKIIVEHDARVELAKNVTEIPRKVARQIRASGNHSRADKN